MKTVRYPDIFKKKLEEIVTSAVHRAISSTSKPIDYGNFLTSLKTVDNLTNEFVTSKMPPAARDYLFIICASTLCRLMETEDK